MNPQPRNLAQLATALESAWLNIPENTFRDLSDSLPTRLAAVHSAKDKSHMASDRVNVEAMRYKVYRNALCGQPIIGWVQRYLINRVLRDTKKALCFCRYHRSACNKTRTYSRVVPRRKNGDEHPPPSGCGRMSLSSFRVHQDATGQKGSARQKKEYENPPS
ncbi:transposable element Tcb1 transposase, partial [Trichonephila clavipes]